jgi:hypothetical protein
MSDQFGTLRALLQQAPSQDVVVHRGGERRFVGLHAGNPQREAGGSVARDGAWWGLAGPRADKPPSVVAFTPHRDVLMSQTSDSSRRPRLRARPFISGQHCLQACPVGRRVEVPRCPSLHPNAPQPPIRTPMSHQ